MNADGSGRTQLTDDATDNLQPTWSPDGARIAFTSHSPILGTPILGTPDIYVMNADGTELKRLTD
jgi:TolB protein